MKMLKGYVCISRLLNIASANNSLYDADMDESASMYLKMSGKS